MNKSVVGIVKSRLEAERIVSAVKAAGYSENDISVLLPDQEGSKDFAHDNSTKAPEGATTGASTGAVVGGALGLAAGLGALAIPGVGPLIAAGPIMAALSGAAVGGAVGGLTGALIGLGIPEYEAKLYEGKIREGNILLAVRGNDNDQLKALEELFKANQASDIHRVGETGVKK
jgi:hypothetical protein